MTTHERATHEVLQKLLAESHPEAVKVFIDGLSSVNSRGSKGGLYSQRREDYYTLVSTCPNSMENFLGAPEPPPLLPKRKLGRPKAPRCNECRSCQNPHWKMPCAQKALLEGLADAAEASSSGSATVVEELPRAPAQVVQREVLRVEVLGDDKELRKHLSYLLKVPLGEIGRIRMTPEKQPALIDAISILTRKNKNDSAEVWRELERSSREVKENILNIHFPGQGQRSTPVAKDLKTLVQVIFMLPGREASLVRQAAAEVFVRFMGGDLTLIQDVQRMNEVQRFLREHEPEHPMRAFGEAVEREPTSSTEVSTPPEDSQEAPVASLPPLQVPPNPVIMKVEDSIGLPGSDHLYAASRLEDNILKIGVSKDVVERMPELSRSFQAGYTLQAVWPGEAALEELVLEKLKPFKAAVGNSREHFDSRVTLEYLFQIVDHARVLYKTKMELSSSASFEQRKKELELQEDLKDRALKRKREELEIESQRRREELLHDLVREKHPLAIEAFLESYRGGQ
jgi:hypothetical protein